MKSPQDMRIIQIDITNACIHRCSNCTRFCGHHKKPFFMDWETFKRAADSFEGYKGTVGIMGGEPTLHPEFERFVRYIQEHPYFPKGENLLVKPTKEFMNILGRMEQRETYVSTEHGIKRNVVNGWGLWSALSTKYREHYELIQDTFNMQAVNDHKNIMYHSPVLFRRKDAGLADEEWHKVRDSCWAQDAWSATITPKGAFFCEIAGALDMLFDGPGGWPIEPGWWKRTPDQFGDQLRWCELCGIAMTTFTRDANDETDDMSPWYFDKLKELGSPKVNGDGMVNLLRFNKDGTVAEESKKNVKAVHRSLYYDSWFSRFSDGNDWLNPHGFTGIIIAEDRESLADCVETARRCMPGLDRVVIGTGNKAAWESLSAEVRGEEKISIVLSRRPSWGGVLNKLLSVCDREHFLLYLDRNTTVAGGCSKFLKAYVMNPGTLMTGQGKNDMEKEIGAHIPAIFSPKAYAIKRAGFDRIAALENLESFVRLWDAGKALPICRESFIQRAYQLEKGVRYAVYGAGPTAEHLWEQFSGNTIVYVTDSDCSKWGKEFHGHSIIGPEELLLRRDAFDKIFIASNSYFEIKTNLLELGFAAEDIVTTLVAL